MDFPVYFINLDRSPDRRAHMERGLRQQGLWEQSRRIAAVDARSGALRNGFTRTLWSRCWSLDDTVVACFESHRKAWRRLLDDRAEVALVLEDDVVFSPRFARSLRDLLPRVGEFDMIKLDGNPFRMRLGPARSHGVLALREIVGTTFSSAGYLVSRAAAERLLQETERYNVAVDIFAFTPRPGWRQYACDPSICVQGMFLDAERSRDLPAEVLASVRHDSGSWMGQTLEEPGWWRAKYKAQVWLTHKLPDALWRKRHLVRAGGGNDKLPLQDDFAAFRW